MAEAAERHHIVGQSVTLQRVLEQIERVANIPRSVLVRGERGTGKELVARAIHRASGPDRPFVAVNCAALPDGLLENELFGHERGGFSGADLRAQGKFELASGGTLFLAEIGNMSAAFQHKILRVVEYGTLRRVGGTREVRVTTRIVAATNVDLEAAMAQGHFLPDL